MKTFNVSSLSIKDVKKVIDETVQDIPANVKYKPELGITQIVNNEAVLNLDNKEPTQPLNSNDGIVLYLILKPQLTNDSVDDLVLRGVNHGFIEHRSLKRVKSISTPNSPTKKESPKRLKRSSSASDPLMRSPPDTRCYHDHYCHSSSVRSARRLKCSHSR